MATLLIGVFSGTRLDHAAAMVNSLRRCARKLKATAPSSKLVLVAPEYCFSASGGGLVDPCLGLYRPRALSEKDKDDIVRRLRALSKEFPDLLLIPGTVAWHKPLDRPLNERRRADDRHRTGDPKTASEGRRDKNALRLLSGAPDPREGKFYLSEQLHKVVARVSGNSSLPYSYEHVNDALRDDQTHRSVVAELRSQGIPFDVQPIAGAVDLLSNTCNQMMRNTAFVFCNDRLLLKYNKRGDFHETIGARATTAFIPGSCAGSFAWEGLDVGLEICVDHQDGFLMRDVAQNSQTAKDLYILCSDWTSNTFQNAPLKQEGYFVHASTNSGVRGVFRKDGTPLLGASIAGDWLHGWQVELGA